MKIRARLFTGFGPLDIIGNTSTRGPDSASPPSAPLFYMAMAVRLFGRESRICREA